MFTLGRAGGRPVFRVLTPTLYRARMAGTRQTLSMDCSHPAPAPAPAPLLPRPQAQDSLDLELGASASRVADRQPAHCASVPEAGGLGGYKLKSLHFLYGIKVIICLQSLSRVSPVSGAVL